MKNFRIIQKSQKEEIENQLQQSENWAEILKTGMEKSQQVGTKGALEDYHSKLYKYERHVELAQQIKDVLLINEALGKLDVQWCEDNKVDFGNLAQAINRLRSEYDSTEINSTKM